MYDATHYYPASVYFGGSSVLLSSLVIVPTWLFGKCSRRNKKTLDILDDGHPVQPDEKTQVNSMLL